MVYCCRVSSGFISHQHTTNLSFPNTNNKERLEICAKNAKSAKMITGEVLYP